MASEHEHIEFGLNEVKELFNTCIITGQIIEIDNANDTADVEITGYGRQNDVPIFYHCPNSSTVGGGSTAFSEDDQVLVLAKNAEGVSCPEFKVVGFADGTLRPCTQESVLVMQNYLNEEGGQEPDDLFCFVWNVTTNSYEEIYNETGELIQFPCLIGDIFDWLSSHPKVYKGTIAGTYCGWEISYGPQAEYMNCYDENGGTPLQRLFDSSSYSYTNPAGSGIESCTGSSSNLTVPALNTSPSYPRSHTLIAYDELGPILTLGCRFAMEQSQAIDTKKCVGGPSIHYYSNVKDQTFTFNTPIKNSEVASCNSSWAYSGSPGEDCQSAIVGDGYATVETITGGKMFVAGAFGDHVFAQFYYCKCVKNSKSGPWDKNPESLPQGETIATTIIDVHASIKIAEVAIEEDPREQSHNEVFANAIKSLLNIEGRSLAENEIPSMEIRK